MSDTYDAVIFPRGYLEASNDGLRFHRTFDLLEKLLGVDRAKGERAWARDRDAGQTLFVSRVATDTEYVPHGQPGAGSPRYSWTEGERGIRYGRLIDHAR